jgi:selenocysteine lyase/cysteine desulfurase
MSKWEELIARFYPQLSSVSYLDYRTRSPIPSKITSRIASFGHSLMPSPHSSEEQSEFDCSLLLLRKKIASLFGVSLINYDVVVFGSAQSALDEIFEGFQWSRGSTFVIDPSFTIDPTSSIQFAERAGARPGIPEVSSSAHSLFCISYSPANSARASDFRRRRPGSSHVLIDATCAAPWAFADLSRNTFDFVLLSMTRICGVELCPALMRLEAAELLAPFFFGGGAVAFSCARTNVHRSYRAHSKRFENGTPPQLAIFCALDGIAVMEELKGAGAGEGAMARFVEAAGARWELESDEVELVVKVRCPAAAEVRKSLAAKKVFVGCEDDAIVVSFGLPTRERDIDGAIEGLAEVLGETVRL